MGFFTAVNPNIETGGLFGESKINILNQIPEKYLPKTIFIKKNLDFKQIQEALKKKNITYPLIAKPDVGERGLLVAKIKTEEALETYLTNHPVDFLLQEFIDVPMELAVMHHRFPGKKKGKITSICVKDPLQVTGDGNSTVRQLMRQIPRAILQLPRFEKDFFQLLNIIPAKDELLILEPIGNHSRGTGFLNGNHLINDKLEAVFDEISNKMEGIFYGRFDLKCKSPEAVENGDFKILEYNGIGAEPAHIYDKAIPIWKKYQIIYQHWQSIFEIYTVQHAKGIRGDTIVQLKEHWKKYHNYMSKIEE